MAQIGDCLPRFGEYGQLFATSDRIKHALCVFYKDVLDFHATVLNFFKLKSLSCPRASLSSAQELTKNSRVESVLRIPLATLCF